MTFPIRERMLDMIFYTVQPANRVVYGRMLEKLANYTKMYLTAPCHQRGENYTSARRAVQEGVKTVSKSRGQSAVPGQHTFTRPSGDCAALRPRLFDTLCLCHCVAIARSQIVLELTHADDTFPFSIHDQQNRCR